MLRFAKKYERVFQTRGMREGRAIRFSFAANASRPRVRAIAVCMSTRLACECVASTLRCAGVHRHRELQHGHEQQVASTARIATSMSRRAADVRATLHSRSLALHASKPHGARRKRMGSWPKIIGLAMSWLRGIDRAGGQHGGRLLLAGVTGAAARK